MTPDEIDTTDESQNYTLWVRHIAGGGWQLTRESKLCKSRIHAERWASKTVDLYQLSAMAYIALPDGEEPTP